MAGNTFALNDKQYYEFMATSPAFKMADQRLNSVWQAAKQQLSAQEFEPLYREQIEWLKKVDVLAAKRSKVMNIAIAEAYAFENNNRTAAITRYVSKYVKGFTVAAASEATTPREESASQIEDNSTERMLKKFLDLSSFHNFKADFFSTTNYLPIDTQNTIIESLYFIDYLYKIIEYKPKQNDQNYKGSLLALIVLYENSKNTFFNLSYLINITSGLKKQHAKYYQNYLTMAQRVIKYKTVNIQQNNNAVWKVSFSDHDPEDAPSISIYNGDSALVIFYSGDECDQVIPALGIPFKNDLLKEADSADDLAEIFGTIQADGKKIYDVSYFPPPKDTPSGSSTLVSHFSIKHGHFLLDSFNSKSIRFKVYFRGVNIADNQFSFDGFLEADKVAYEACLRSKGQSKKKSTQDNTIKKNDTFETEEKELKKRLDVLKRFAKDIEL